MTPAATVDAATAGEAPLRRWWRGLGTRDRRLAVAAAAVVGVYALWALAIAPAARTLARAPLELDRLDRELAAMQQQAAEATSLRATPPIGSAQSTAALKSATEQLGGKARLTLQGTRAVLTVDALPPETLLAWLAEIRSGARAQPVEANLSRVDGGFSGTIVVAIGGSA